MKYYEISIAHDLNVIGHYSQTKLEKGYDPSLPHSHWQVKPNAFPDFVPNYELRLHNKAKPTDYLDGHGIIGMLVNKRLKNILEKHKLPPHRFHAVKVYHKNDLLNYYWFQYIVDDFWFWLNKEKSRGVVYDINKNFKAIRELDLEKPLDYFNNLDYYELPFYQKLRWEKVVFKKDFPKYDVYQTRTIDYTDIISNRLLDTLISENITGFKTTFYDKISIDN